MPVATLLVAPLAARAQNVGIGTTQPTQKLDVDGNVRVRGLGGADPARLLSVDPDGTLRAQAPLSAAAPVTPQSPASLGAAFTDARPVAVALNAAGTRAFVVNSTDNTLQTFDVSGPGMPVFLGRAPTGLSPSAVAVNGAGTRAYVVNSNNNTLQYYDVSGPGAPVSLGTVSTGTYPFGVAVNPAGTRAFVANRFDGTLQTYDLSSGVPVSLATTVPAGSDPGAVTVNAAGTRAFVVNRTAYTYQVFDVSGPGAPVRVRTMFTDYDPAAVAADPSAPRIFIANQGSNTLRAFDVSATVPRSQGTVPTGDSPAGVAVNPAGTRAFVVNQNVNTLEVYDVSSSGVLTSLGTVRTGDSPVAVAVNPAGTRAFVVNKNSNTLQAFRVGATLLVGLGPDGALGSVDPASLGSDLGDNLGNHTATRNLDLGPNQLVGNGGSQGLSIGNGGRVGVGVGSPVSQLANTSQNVIGSDQFGVGANSLTWLHDAQGYAAAVGNSGAASGGNGLAVKVTNSSSSTTALDVSQGASPSAAGTTLLRVRADGNVGIGVGAPSARLDVAGSTRLRGLSTAGVVTTDASGNLGSVAASTLADNLGNHTATQNLNLGNNQLVGNGGSSGLSVASTGAVTLAAGLSLPIRTVSQVAGSYQNVALTDVDYTVRSGSPQGVNGGAVFSFFLPDPAGRTGRVYVLLNYGNTNANLYTDTPANSQNAGLVYDDASGSVTQLPKASRLMVQSNGAIWLVLAR